jgi:uncharacterized RDD family membrane protein YckC
MPYVGFWRRVLAYLIDAVLINVVLVVLHVATGGMIYETATMGATQDGVGFQFNTSPLGTIIAFLGGWLYFALMESSARQATLGKMAIGAKVTDLQGQRIGFARATGRYFAKILSAVILLIGYIMVGLTKRKQGLHDMIAGTLVLNRDAVPAQAHGPAAAPPAWPQQPPPPPPPPSGHQPPSGRDPDFRR